MRKVYIYIDINAISEKLRLDKFLIDKFMLFSYFKDIQGNNI